MFQFCIITLNPGRRASDYHAVIDYQVMVPTIGVNTAASANFQMVNFVVDWANVHSELCDIYSCPLLDIK